MSATSHSGTRPKALVCDPRVLAILGFSVLTLIAPSAFAQAPPDAQLRYKVFYQCNGERVQVDHCRKDDDGKGYGPPTRPQENYCLVYYPDRPRRGGFMVQSVELFDDIVKKLQACGALAVPSSAPVARAPSAAPSVPAASSQSSSEGLVAMCRATYDKQDFVKAITYCQQATSVDNDPNLLVFLGLSYQHEKRYAEAEATMKQAIRLKPDEGLYPFALGQIYYESQQCPKAIDAFKSALEHHLEADLQATATHWLGRCYAQAEKYDLAANALRQSLSLQPQDPSIIYDLGVVYFDAKQYKEAEPLLLQTLRLKPGQVGCNYFLGWISNNNSQYTKAVAYLKAELRLNPDDPFSYGELGYAYLQLKQYAEAQAAAQHAIRLKADYAEAQYVLGASYARTGKKDDAFRVYQTLAKLDESRSKKLLDEIHNAMGNEVLNHLKPKK